MTATQLTQSMKQSSWPSNALKTIVVPTDFSDSARCAMDWAAELAKAHKAEIVLVHAVDDELPALAKADVNKHVTCKLNSIRNSLIAGRVRARTDYDHGRPWDVIAKHAKKVQADLVVIGAHGRSKLSERILGTVADRLVKTTSSPVLVHRGTESGAASKIRTVVAATDFSEEAALAISTAVRLVSASNDRVRLVLFHTVALPINQIEVDVPMPLPEYWDESERKASCQLQTMAASLRSDHLEVGATTFRGYPAEAILQQAAAVGANLIAIGTLGRTGLNRFFLGSVAERVLHHAKCPVLIVRRPDDGAPIQLSAE